LHQVLWANIQKPWADKKKWGSGGSMGADLMDGVIECDGFVAFIKKNNFNLFFIILVFYIY
jgi:hypothetical protein